MRKKRLMIESGGKARGDQSRSPLVAEVESRARCRHSAASSRAAVAHTRLDCRPRTRDAHIVRHWAPTSDVPEDDHRGPSTWEGQLAAGPLAPLPSCASLPLHACLSREMHTCSMLRSRTRPRKARGPTCSSGEASAALVRRRLLLRNLLRSRLERSSEHSATRRPTKKADEPVSTATAEESSAAGPCAHLESDDAASRLLIAGSACTCSLTLLGQGLGRRLAPGRESTSRRSRLPVPGRPLASPPTAPSGMAPLRASRCPLLRSAQPSSRSVERQLGPRLLARSPFSLAPSPSSLESTSSSTR